MSTALPKPAAPTGETADTKRLPFTSTSVLPEPIAKLLASD